MAYAFSGAPSKVVRDHIPLEQGLRLLRVRTNHTSDVKSETIFH